MNESGQAQNVNFSVDKDNLYREESITDLKVASIRKLIPVNSDGTDDSSRKAMFLGYTQLVSPQGPVPIHSELSADSLEKAIEAFPGAMKLALADMVEKAKKMQQEQQNQKEDGSRIIMPGR